MAGYDPPQDSRHTRRSYSKDIRNLVIYQKCTLGYRTADISIHLNISHRVVQRILKLWRETGEVTEGPGRLGKRSRVMDCEEMEVHALS